MKFLNSSSSTVIAGNLTFQVGVSTEISGYTIDTTTLKALGQALQNGSLLPLDNDAKRFIGLNNLSPALFNLPDNNIAADGLVPAMLSVDTSGNTLGIVGADGKAIPLLAPSNVLDTILLGDSMTAGNHGTTAITSASRLNGVVTVVTGAGHQLANGQLANIFNMLPADFNANNTQITFISSTSFSYISSGLDGSASNLSGSKGMFMLNPQQQADSYFFWLNSKRA